MDHTLLPLNPQCSDLQTQISDYRQQNILHSDSQYVPTKVCVLVPSLYFLYTHNYTAKSCPTPIYKFTEDITVKDRILNNAKTE